METINWKSPFVFAADRRATSDPNEVSSVGPEVSPYTSQTCKIFFRNHQPFSVPHDFVRKIAKLDKLCDDSSLQISIPEVPDEAGHVFVHYLHTGAWQILRGSDSPSDDLAGLEISTHVYAAAMAYGVPDLAELARTSMSLFAAALPALDVIVAVSGACQLLPEDDLWFAAWAKTRLELLFGDPASLDQSVLLGCFHKDTACSKVLLKALVRICSERFVPADPAASQPACQRSSVTNTASNHSMEGVATPESASAMEPTLEPGPVDGGGAVAESPLDPVSAPVAPPEPEPVVELPLEAPCTDAVEPEIGPAVASVTEPDDPWVAWTFPVPLKDKKKKKKKDRLVPECLPECEPAPSLYVVDYPPEPVSDEVIPKKSNEKKKGLTALWAPEPEPEPEPEADLFEWSQPISKKEKKKKKGSMAVEPEPWISNAEPEPVLKGKCPDWEFHVRSGGWKDCRLCHEFVGELSTDYKSTSYGDAWT